MEGFLVLFCSSHCTACNVQKGVWFTQRRRAVEKVQTLNPDYHINSQDTHWVLMCTLVEEETSTTETYHQPSISPYDKSHCYASHLNTQASSELFTPLRVTPSLIYPGTTHLTLQISAFIPHSHQKLGEQLYVKGSNWKEPPPPPQSSSVRITEGRPRISTVTCMLHHRDAWFTSQ